MYAVPFTVMVTLVLVVIVRSMLFLNNINLVPYFSSLSTFNVLRHYPCFYVLYDFD